VNRDSAIPTVWPPKSGTRINGSRRRYRVQLAKDTTRTFGSRFVVGNPPRDRHGPFAPNVPNANRASGGRYQSASWRAFGAERVLWSARLLGEKIGGLLCL
jgi:hypothetical protein